MIVFLVFGFVEVGWFVNCQHVLHDAARQGARAAVHLENSNAEVRQAVLDSLSTSMDIDPDNVTVRLSKLDSDGDEEYQVMDLSENEQGERIRVTVTVNYADMYPPSNYLGFASGVVSNAVVMQRLK